MLRNVNARLLEALCDVEIYDCLRDTWEVDLCQDCQVVSCLVNTSWMSLPSRFFCGYHCEVPPKINKHQAESKTSKPSPTALMSNGRWVRPCALPDETARAVNWRAASMPLEAKILLRLQNSQHPSVKSFHRKLPP